jgi:hypothetical protein
MKQGTSMYATPITSDGDLTATDEQEHTSGEKILWWKPNKQREKSLIYKNDIDYGIMAFSDTPATIKPSSLQK